MERVVVTGMGTVNPLGLSVEESWKNAINGVSGVGPITLFDPHSLQVHIACEVKGFEPEIYMDGKEARRRDRFEQLGAAAAKEALASSGLEITEANAERVGVIVSAAIGGIRSLQDAVITNHTEGPRRVSPAGTDVHGRDIFSRIIHGTRISRRIGFLGMLLGCVVGVVLGLVSGYYGGWPDTLIMRLLDVQLAFPGLLVAICIIAIIGPGLENVILAVGIFSVPVRPGDARAGAHPEGAGVHPGSPDDGRAGRPHHADAPPPQRRGPHPGPLHPALDWHGDPHRGKPQLSRARRTAAHPRMGCHAQRRPCLLW